MEECTETVNEVKIVGKNEDKCSSCILYTVLLSIFFGASFVCYKYMNHNKENISKYDYTYHVKSY